MKHTFIRSVPKEKSIAEKNKGIITDLWFDKNLAKKIPPPRLDKVMEECEKINFPFTELLKKYSLSKKEKNKKKILKDIISSLKLFGRKIKEVLTINLADKNLCAFIAFAWTEIIQNLIKEAYTSRDTHAIIMATQLQIELTTAFYEVFE